METGDPVSSHFFNITDAILISEQVKRVEIEVSKFRSLTW